MISSISRLVGKSPGGKAGALAASLVAATSHGLAVDVAFAEATLAPRAHSSQAAPERKGQVNFAKLTHALDPHTAHIDLAPPRRGWRGLSGQFELPGRSAAFEQIIDGLPAGVDLGLETRKLAQGGDGVLPWAADGAARFHQRPVFVGGAIDRAAMPAQIHERSLRSRQQRAQRAVLHYGVVAPSHQQVCEQIGPPASKNIFRPASDCGRWAR